MKSDSLTKLRRSVAISYFFMFLALFTVIGGIFAYWFARKVTLVDSAEVWLQAQALWVMRSVVIYMILVGFAALWFIPLAFFVWDQFIWVTACTIIGVIFAVVAWLFLLNAWLKGISKFISHKPVY